MLFYTLKVNEKEYRCRLTAKACVDLEKRLGTNPLNVLAKVGNNNELPPLESLIVILHSSLQTMEHGITLDKAYEIYDEYVDSGKTLIDFITEIIEIFKTSGFFNEEDTKN